jgi:hypothetical protein
MTMRRSDAPFALLACVAAALAIGHASVRPEGAAATAVEPQAAAIARERPASGSASEALPRPSAEEVSRKFGRPGSRSPAKAAPPALPSPVRKADWLHPVGTIEDSGGTRWLFIKDDRSGRVIRLRADGELADEGRVIDSSKDEPVIEMDSVRYSIRGR